jgi:hypothetical protein
MTEEAQRVQTADRRRREARSPPFLDVGGFRRARRQPLGLGVSLYWRLSSRSARPVILAVLPFQNASGDSSLDFLRLALSGEVASTLSYKRSLSRRVPFGHCPYIGTFAIMPPLYVLGPAVVLGPFFLVLQWALIRAVSRWYALGYSAVVIAALIFIAKLTKRVAELNAFLERRDAKLTPPTKPATQS